MGLELRSRLARATLGLNSVVARILPQRRHLLVLAYHRVGTDEQVLPEAPEMTECDAEVFARQMTWLRRSCTVLNADEVLAVVRGQRPCPNRAVFVTFDDGYRDALFRVQDCLDRLGIRPTVFLATHFVGTRHRFWWERVSVCVRTTAVRRLRWEGLDLAFDDAHARSQTARALAARAKALANSRAREHFIEALETRLDVPDTRRAQRPLVVSWDEARALLTTYDFGAHTRTHPVLSQLDADQAREELVGSKAELERQLQRPCHTVAIPFGAAADYTPLTVRLAAEAGFRLIFSLENTLRRPPDCGNLHLVDRVALTREDGLAGMALKVTWPALFVPDWTDRARHFASWAVRRLAPGSGLETSSGTSDGCC